MPVERHFLGWNAPVTAKVREFLLPSQFSAPIDLGKELIIVPTLQAGRRLRETLALYCTEQNTALLSPLVVTPTFLLRSDNEPANIASQIEMAAVWANILMNLDISNYKGLFPSQTPKRDFTWAIHTGEMIQQLRETLLEGGYLITDVYQKFGEIIEESERWQNLSDLETAYLTRIGELGRSDPYALMINRSQKPELPEGIERIVIAAVPDPALHIVQALEKLAEQVPIAVLIHAPESLADHFDKWGRPIPEKWNERMIEIPAAEKNILLSSSHITQSHKAIEIIAEETDRFGPSDIAIGVPDNSITSFISSDLAENGLPTFDPSG